MITPYELPKSEWPSYLLGHKELKGIMIGSCRFGHWLIHGKALIADDGGFYYKHDNTCEIAHAHSYHPIGHVGGLIKDYGWICVPSLAVANCRYTMLHELAHLKAPGHTKKWGETLLSLGGTLQSHYVTPHLYGADYVPNLKAKPTSRTYYKPV